VNSQKITVIVSLLVSVLCPRAYGQEVSLEQRQPLELVYADSIVPQDTHEMMLTSGAWYLRSGDLHDSFLAQKIEWGISDSLQVAAFVHLVRSSNLIGATVNGFGDMEIGARYTWATVGSQFTHIALAFDAGFPTGDPRKGLGEGKYTVSPSLLLSREFRKGKYQVFSTSGAEFIAGHRVLGGVFDAQPHHSIFANSGLSRRIGHGWGIGELSVSSNRWSGGNETQIVFTPSYVWRVARRTELLLGVPIGLTSSAQHFGVVVKFTFELGGPRE
jgi:hypothetical protein